MSETPEEDKARRIVKLAMKFLDIAGETRFTRREGRAGNTWVLRLSDRVLKVWTVGDKPMEVLYAGNAPNQLWWVDERLDGALEDLQRAVILDVISEC